MLQKVVTVNNNVINDVKVHIFYKTKLYHFPIYSFVIILDSLSLSFYLFFSLIFFLCIFFFSFLFPFCLFLLLSLCFIFSISYFSISLPFFSQSFSHLIYICNLFSFSLSYFFYLISSSMYFLLGSLVIAPTQDSTHFLKIRFWSLLAGFTPIISTMQWNKSDKERKIARKKVNFYRHRRYVIFVYFTHLPFLLITFSASLF